MVAPCTTSPGLMQACTPPWPEETLEHASLPPSKRQQVGTAQPIPVPRPSPCLPPLCIRVPLAAQDLPHAQVQGMEGIQVSSRRGAGGNRRGGGGGRRVTCGCGRCCCCCCLRHRLGSSRCRSSCGRGGGSSSGGWLGLFFWGCTCNTEIQLQHAGREPSSQLDGGRNSYTKNVEGVVSTRGVPWSLCQHWSTDCRD